MSIANNKRWTHDDFEQMSWHDNHVHGFHVTEGQHGSGEVSFDLDYILEWLKQDSGSIGFRIAPATLTFQNVSHLELGLDYAKPSAALSPFSIDSIERRQESRDRYIALVWQLNVNWPEGFFRFEATGFEQVLRSEPVISMQQVLTAEERGDGV
jgi:hypothetical protein